MPERGIEFILLTSLVAKEYFVPGGSLFSKVYKLQTFFFFAHPTQSLWATSFQVQVVEFLRNSWTVYISWYSGKASMAKKNSYEDYRQPASEVKDNIC